MGGASTAIAALLRRGGLAAALLPLLSAVLAAAGLFAGQAAWLRAPGLRPLADPLLVVPADRGYQNRPVALPAYRRAGGAPAAGWARRYVATRRFESHRSAWVYFRTDDLARSVTAPAPGARGLLRLWPAGTVLVLESYRGDAPGGESHRLAAIDVIAKLPAVAPGFHPSDWVYGRFNPDGRPNLAPAEALRCHGCHRIAFELTGDLVFTRF